jgi:FKBP-type peptidyl-prolyl cis-trans isomerase
VLAVCALACATSPSPSNSELPRAKPGVLYAIGANLGRQISMYELDEDEAREVSRGLTDAARNKPYAGVMTPETAGYLGEFTELRLRALARSEEEAGAPLLEAAAREPGAHEFESGLVLRVIEKGSGPAPTIWDFVTIRYHGTLRDGTVFDSNRDKDPQRFRLGATMRCWQEAFTSVTAGTRMHVVCPPALGYGWGSTGDVPGGSVLTFDLELLSVEPMPEPPEPPS